MIIFLCVLVWLAMGVLAAYMASYYRSWDTSLSEVAACSLSGVIGLVTAIVLLAKHSEISEAIIFKGKSK